MDGCRVVDVPQMQRIQKEEILARLRRVEGQIRGIQRMIGEERDCEAVVTQLMAARAALDGASLYVVSSHLEQCLRHRSDATGKAQLDRILEFFLRFARVPDGLASSETADQS